MQGSGAGGDAVGDDGEGEPRPLLRAGVREHIPVGEDGSGAGVAGGKEQANPLHPREENRQADTHRAGAAVLRGRQPRLHRPYRQPAQTIRGNA